MRGGVAVEGGGVVEHAHGDVAGAAGDVEDALLLARFGRVGGVRVDARVEAADEVVFPQAVDAQGHEVVHCVVAAGDGGEDIGDWRGVVLVSLSLVVHLALSFDSPTFRSLQALRHSLIAEMRRLLGLPLLLFGRLERSRGGSEGASAAVAHPSCGRVLRNSYALGSAGNVRRHCEVKGWCKERMCLNCEVFLP